MSGLLNLDAANRLISVIYRRANEEWDATRGWPHCGLQQAIWDIERVVKCLQVAAGHDPFYWLSVSEDDDICETCGRLL